MLATTAAIAACLAGAVAARAADGQSVPGSLVAKVASCGVATEDRSATFYARMDAIPGAAKLAIRFQLLERLGHGQPFAKVDVPALRTWHFSAAGVKRYGWKQTVDNLHVGGSYKARVQYRWISATGAVLDTQVRDTPVCHGPQPNITIGDMTIKPGPTADTRTYRVTVQNSGKTVADDVGVALSVDRADLDTATIDQLAAGESRVVSFTGPACRREVGVVVDPDNSIGERVESDNSRLFVCS